MKNNFKNILMCGACALLMSGASVAKAEGELALYHWFEYIPQELLEKFSKDNDIKVIMDTYDSNETMLASLKAGKIGTYDIAVPSDYMVKIMGDQDLLGKFEHSELKNFGNIVPQWVDVSFDEGRKSSIPYQWGTTSFAVRTDLYGEDINNTDLMFNPPEALVGKINMFDSLGDVITMASLHLDIPQCSTDRDQLKALNTLLQEAKPKWASISSDIAKDALVSGDVTLSMIWNGFSSKARTEGAKVKYAFPEQGHIVWMDNAVLLKDAPNRDNAIKFLDFLLEPEVAAAISNYAQYSPGVTGADQYLGKALLEAPETNPLETSKGVFVEVCAEEVQKVYDTIWTNLKK